MIIPATELILVLAGICVAVSWWYIKRMRKHYPPLRPGRLEKLDDALGTHLMNFLEPKE